ncbi:hypothetical protein A9179_15530 [Pseudomonas alcaligenes]|uniref:Phage baseplate protein n=1 Tax=Aquipseudomonas alcaligenes TaxID=43263 RepID=A0ABR7S402_AQUAC|nr:hypothetical protein [Pseudomonas alcaligenes]MBC9251684.1 hypothetical protein [Pseudomonas alcaligenes]
MATLDTITWLHSWESSRALPAALQPCAVLAPLLDEGQAAAERLPLGQRDAALLDVYGALFGNQLQAVARCPHCGERLELELDSRSLRLPSPALPAQLSLEWQGYHVAYRLPDSRDLAGAAQAGSPGQARTLLLQRCVLQLLHGQTPVVPEQCPEALFEALAEAMAAADPQALTELALSCPACAGQWQECFDIGAFLLERLGDWAERQFDQVHLLAQAYGWSEAQILALSPARRARYLSRVLA